MWASCCWLTLSVPKTEYSRRFRSIPWLLMSWLLASPGVQQPWPWLCKINRSLRFMRRVSSTSIFQSRELVDISLCFLKSLRQERSLQWQTYTVYFIKHGHGALYCCGYNTVISIIIASYDPIVFVVHNYCYNLIWFLQCGWSDPERYWKK